MLSEVHYLIRSKADGRYITARPHEDESGYLLLFRENFEALSYLNTHAGDLFRVHSWEVCSNAGVLLVSP